MNKKMKYLQTGMAILGGILTIAATLVDNRVQSEEIEEAVRKERIRQNKEKES